LGRIPGFSLSFLLFYLAFFLLLSRLAFLVVFLITLHSFLLFFFLYTGYRFGMPELVDPDTPQSVRTRTGFDGEEYELVFSDEFNVDGRTFYPGDDPYWEAVDLWYWATNDQEWYDPGQITTANGSLQITMEEVTWHGLPYRSGMLQSWNKFCFSSGYIEVSLTLPGPNENTQGYVRCLPLLLLSSLSIMRDLIKFCDLFRFFFVCLFLVARRLDHGQSRPTRIRRYDRRDMAVFVR
jgi:hypothetical protein